MSGAIPKGVVVELKNDPAQEGKAAIAVKKFSLLLRQAFERERKMLLDVRSLQNERIVCLIAALQLGNDHCLILPLATCDLRVFWSRTDPTSDPENHSTWFVEETEKFILALRSIHTASRMRLGQDGASQHITDVTTLGIIHGDIKPSNILVYPSITDGKPVLKWNDFGLSTWADEPPMYRTNRTYDAPENALRLKPGTKSDIWSLGCVLFEFVIWLLQGFDAVQSYATRRSMATPGSGRSLTDDHFYTLVYEDQRPVRAEVRFAILNGLEQIIQDQRCVGALGKIVQLISGSMLVVDPRERSSSTKLVQKLLQDL